MIVSASRRTDIPAYYAQWMLNRLREGNVIVPYPRNPNKLGSIRLSPDNVDCIVFWSKNPAPMLNKLDAIDALGYRYYFTFTITGYGTDIEKNLPPQKTLVETFLRLSERLGPKRVDWRFDPVMVSGRYSPQWHLDAFGALCRRLSGATERCIINFIKAYRHLPHIAEMDVTDVKKLAVALARIAKEYGVPLYNCTEAWDLREAGIRCSSCIDKEKIEAICGYPIKVKKDPGQPQICNCMQSIDIGMYDSCGNGCTYCYATTSAAKTAAQMANHNASSPMLIGCPEAGQTVTDRTAETLREDQLRLF